MSTISFQCPHCGQSYEGSSEDIGSQAECASCGRSFGIEAGAVMVVGKARPSGLLCYLGALRRYFGFRGRMGRREFWWAALFQFTVMFVVGFVDGATGAEMGLISVFAIATVFPAYAAAARRLHDTDKSGWWVFLFFMPVLNLAFLAWLVQKGDSGPNRFGPDPKVS